MRRLLSVLLVLFLMLSHGTMTAAAPHDEEHVHHVMLDHVDADHAVQADIASNAAGDEGDKPGERTQPDIGHVHVVVDHVPFVVIADPFERALGETGTPTNQALIMSAAFPPLLEPPSA